MKQSCLLISALMAFALGYSQEKKVFTPADYDKAVAMLSSGAAAKAYNSQVLTPLWLPDGKLWYRQGAEYITIDPKAKKGGLTRSAESPAPQMRPARRPGNDLGVPSPDGRKTVYIKDWNLWVKDLGSGAEKQLTTDGVKDFGYATDNAGWTHSDRAIVLWSPDSRKIATFQQDQRHLKDMYLVRAKAGAPELEAWKYSLPADSAVSKIHRVIIDVETAATVRLKIPPDDRKGTLCDDIACDGSFTDNEWSADATRLAFVSVSRDHKRNRFRIADAATGEVKDIFEEVVPTQFASGQGMFGSPNWRFFPETAEAVWYSERDGWGHLYLYDLTTGKVKRQLTSGNYVVSRILNIDLQKKEIVFEARGREAGENPYYNHAYKIGFDGRKMTALTPEPGNHNLRFSPDGNYFVDTYSTPVTPPVINLKDLNGKIIAPIGSVDLAKVTATGWKAPEVFSVKSANGQFDLYGLLYTPTDLDPSRKYPVVVYIYPGPQGGSVGGSWSFSVNSGDFQALAALGFVVMRLEGSCNPNRSKAFQDACYGNIAENTLPDQIAGLKQLAAKYSFIDLDKVGIWGHSGGGFATAAALLKYPEFFKVGVAQAGNHDNRVYEDEWGERYIGLLAGDNYEKQANQTYAGNLKGKLLIAHGAMDNNVPPYGAYLLVDALIKANKTFDLPIFPYARHGFGEDNNYMMRRRWDYFVTHLKGAIPPEEYKIN